MAQISARDKRSLMIGGLIVVFYSLFTFVVKPMHTQQVQIEKQIESKIQFLRKYQGILSQKPYYEAKKKETQKINGTLSRSFLNEAKPGLAAASLQKILEGLARQATVKIERVRVEKQKFTERLLTVPVEITTRSSLRDLAHFIFQIENHTKFFVIEKMTSRRTNKTEPEQLQTKMRVSGFIRELEPENAKKKT